MDGTVTLSCTRTWLGLKPLLDLNPSLYTVAWALYLVNAVILFLLHGVIVGQPDFSVFSTSGLVSSAHSPPHTTRSHVPCTVICLPGTWYPVSTGRDQFLAFSHFSLLQPGFHCTGFTFSARETQRRKDTTAFNIPPLWCWPGG